METKKNWYKCYRCGKYLQRESNKMWLPSYCEEVGLDVYIKKVKKLPGPKSKLSVRKLWRIFFWSVVIFVILFMLRVRFTNPQSINLNKQGVKINVNNIR